MRKTLEIYKDNDILEKYLELKKGELRNMKLELYDQETAVEVYAYNLAKEAAEKPEKKGIKKGAFEMS